MHITLKHPGIHPDYHIYEILNLFTGQEIKTLPEASELSVECKDDDGNTVKTVNIPQNDRKINDRKI